MLYLSRNPHGGDIYENDIELDYSANVNPFGTPQGVKAAVERELDNLYRYPDPYCRALVSAIAESEGVAREYILCGNGAAELIYAYTEALKPRKAMELAPTFSEYSLGLRRWGTEILRYELKIEEGFRVREDILDFIEENGPELIFLCNPNNPSGCCIEEGLLYKILRLCKEKNIRLFLDECFMDLCDSPQSMKHMLRDFHDLTILKAFTKSYGMAGIRLGFCLSADSELLKKMSQAVQPWNVSSLAQSAGIAALREEDFLKKVRELIPLERGWLREKLMNLGFWVSDSQTNFLLFKAPAGLDKELRKFKIAIRNCDNYPGLEEGFYRIAVRKREENQRLIAAIESICGRG